MRYAASEKLEIIRTVEASHLSARQTLATLGIPPSTYYRWYDRWSEGGLGALDDTALDKNLREEMQLELRAMQRTLGITFVFVTHDQEEAMTLSDRIAMMSGGKILQLDTPKGLYERPVNREVAEFIGTMNLIPAKAGATSGGRVALDAAALGRLEGQTATEPPAKGSNVFLALRPERLSVGSDLGAKARLKGRIAEAVYLGDRINYVVDVKGLAHPLRVVNANETGEILGLGTEVDIGWPNDSGLVLG